MLTHNCREIANVPDDNFVPNSKITKPYSRPTKAGPNTAQTNSVQGKPCVDCGDVTSKQVADHINPLSVEYYRTGKNNVAKQKKVDAVQPHCPACSRSQGEQLSAFSRRMKKALGID